MDKPESVLTAKMIRDFIERLVKARESRDLSERVFAVPPDWEEIRKEYGW